MAALERAVTGIQLSNYISLVVITTIGYDYILTLPQEIRYIWNKHWTWVSTLFVLARYFGLCFAILDAIRAFKIRGADFAVLIRFDQRKDVFVSCLPEGNIIYLLDSWSAWIFLSATDLLMILRVSALYDRSRLILGILSTFYVIEVFYFLAVFVIYSTHSRLNPTKVRTGLVLQYSFCEMEYNSVPIWDEAVYGFQIAFGVLLCLLTAIKFIQESLEMYIVTKQFQLNRYMKRLVRDGMIYFITILVLTLINILGNARCIPTGGWQIVPAILLQEIPPMTLIPRFILSLRELHARDVQGRRGGDIDTEFGFGPGSVQGAAASATASTSAGQSENGEQDGGQVQMDERAGIRDTCSNA